MRTLETIIIVFGIAACILFVYISESILNFGLIGGLVLVLFLISGIVFIYCTSKDVKS